ncbi:hypothetical protein [Desulfosporosinus fructosivorans]|nr:hypothetical protein [Desulfosporosinus fructosivorans]
MALISIIWGGFRKGKGGSAIHYSPPVAIPLRITAPAILSTGRV